MSTVDSVKKMSQQDADQNIRQSYNPSNATLGIDGFLAGLVGRKITFANSTTTVANDTLVIDFYENFGANLLYEYTLIFTDGTQAVLLSATRTQ